MITIKRSLHNKINNIYKAMMALLICVTFISFYTTSLFNYNINIKRHSNSEILYKAFHHEETINGANEKIKSVKSFNDQVIVESEETFLDKILLSSQCNAIISNLLFSFSYLFIILSLCMLYQYFRVWIVQVTQSRYKLLLVHYIQMKDGKKSVLSYSYSF